MNNKGKNMGQLFMLTILSGLFILGVASLWGETGAYYGKSVDNDTLSTYQKINETNAEYEDLFQTFSDQSTSDNALLSGITLLGTGIWTVIKQFTQSVDFLIGSGGLVSQIGRLLPVPAWFIAGCITLIIVGVFFMMIDKGSTG